MQALTLTQPWASLIATGRKTVETRDWPWQSLVGRPLLIHAAKTYGGIKGIPDPDTGEPLPGTRRGYDRVCAGLAGPLERAGLDPDELPLGCFVALSIVVAMVPDEATGHERSLVDARLSDGDEALLGSYGPGRWYWLLDTIRTVPRPVAATGQQGVWTPTADETTLVVAQLQART